jgi:hypothetical protein
MYTPATNKRVPALCVDGRIRSARVTGEPDTWFSCPASVKVRGKTVSGFLVFDRGEQLEFIAYSYGKNGSLLPGINKEQYLAAQENPSLVGATG